MWINRSAHWASLHTPQPRRPGSFSKLTETLFLNAEQEQDWRWHVQNNAVAWSAGRGAQREGSRRESPSRAGAVSCGAMGLSQGPALVPHSFPAPAHLACLAWAVLLRPGLGAGPAVCTRSHWQACAAAGHHSCVHTWGELCSREPESAKSFGCIGISLGKTQNSCLANTKILRIKIAQKAGCGGAHLYIPKFGG